MSLRNYHIHRPLCCITSLDIVVLMRKQKEKKTKFKSALVFVLALLVRFLKAGPHR